MEHIALIGDVHGNVPALNAVIDDIKARGISRVFSLGDVVGGGPDGEEAFNICYPLCEKMIKGNWEAFFVDFPDHPKAEKYNSHLSESTLRKIAEQPMTLKFFMSGRRIHLFHGRPLVPDPMWMEASAEEMGVMFSIVEDEYTPDIIGYADLHRQYIYDFINELKTIFNTGSVGNSFTSPNACYAILHGDYGSEKNSPFSIEFVRVPYDIELAVEHAMAQSDWFDYEPYIATLRKGQWHDIN